MEYKFDKINLVSSPLQVGFSLNISKILILSFQHRVSSFFPYLVSKNLKLTPKFVDETG